MPQNNMYFSKYRFVCLILEKCNTLIVIITKRRNRTPNHLKNFIIPSIFFVIKI